jgi:hypothetical protein
MDTMGVPNVPPCMLGPNSLYIVLFDHGDKSYTLHWMLYLLQNENLGSFIISSIQQILAAEDLTCILATALGMINHYLPPSI